MVKPDHSSSFLAFLASDEIRLVCLRHLEKPWISSLGIKVFIFLFLTISFDSLFANTARKIFPSTFRRDIAMILEIFFLRHKAFLCLFHPSSILEHYNILEHFLYFVCHPVGTRSLPRASLFFFFITDAISFYDGSSQSNSDSGGSTSTFLGHGPRSLFRSGSECVFFRYCSTSSFAHFK